MRKTNIKLVKTGNYYEVFTYDDGFFYGYSLKKNGRKEETEIQGDGVVKYSDNGVYQKQASYRSLSKVVRLILGNIDTHPQFTLKFMTLTFAENMSDLGQANTLFTKFIKRLDYYCKKKIKYIAVHERQTRGAIHYHMLVFNMDVIPQAQLEKIWRHGIVDIRRVNRTYGLYGYITKYVTKSFLDVTVKNKKRFFYALDNHIEVERDQRINAGTMLKLLSNKDYMIDKPYEYARLDKNGNSVGRITKFKFLVSELVRGGVASPPL